MNINKDSFYTKEELLDNGINQNTINKIPYIEYATGRKYDGLDVLRALGYTQELKEVFDNLYSVKQ